MASLMMKLLLLTLIIGGTIPSSLGVELESLVSQRGRFGSQIAGKNNYLGFEDHVKRNHTRGNFRSKRENIQTAFASNQNFDANFRHNHMIMPRLLMKRYPCHYTSGVPSCSPPGGHG
ncbi:hypothetical protein MANES_10G108325v8 [Manihot esculenta]|uniref:Uncharacterized protein n=1 Tax=Manihot esculenta TaxID=3983 RepID=A0ACB7H1N5_MANES|nr:hypothetical protein MANES_10G108325v8 [Manihot esculenta]